MYKPIYTVEPAGPARKGSPRFWVVRKDGKRVDSFMKRTNAVAAKRRMQKADADLRKREHGVIWNLFKDD